MYSGSEFNRCESIRAKAMKVHDSGLELERCRRHLRPYRAPERAPTWKKTFYRRSIWQDDSRYAYDYFRAHRRRAEDHCSPRLDQRRQNNLAPIAPAQLIAIGNATKAMPNATKIKQKDRSEYLKAGLEPDGAGIAILICMLAAETGGEYAPIDRKVIAELKVYNRAAVESYEAIALSLMGISTKKGIDKFAQVYVANVMPVWRQLRKEHSAQAEDNFLAKRRRR